MLVSLPHNHLNAIREATLEVPMRPRATRVRHFVLVLFLPLRNCQRPNVYHVGILQGAVCSGCAVAFRSVSHLSSSLKMEAPFPRKLRNREQPLTHTKIKTLRSRTGVNLSKHFEEHASGTWPGVGMLELDLPGQAGLDVTRT